MTTTAPAPTRSDVLEVVHNTGAFLLAHVPQIMGWAIALGAVLLRPSRSTSSYLLEGIVWAQAAEPVQLLNLGIVLVQSLVLLGLALFAILRMFALRTRNILVGAIQVVAGLWIGLNAPWLLAALVLPILFNRHWIHLAAKLHGPYCAHCTDLPHLVTASPRTETGAQ